MALTNGLITVFDLLDGTSQTINAESVIYTPTFICKRNVTYAFAYEFSSGGSVNCKIEIEQGNEPPATEKAASDNMVVPEDAADFDVSVTDKNLHIKAYNPAATKFLRAKVTGLSGNAATTKLDKFDVCTEVNL